MNNFARLAALAAVATIAATPANAQSAEASPKATARVTVSKPLTLTAEQNLDFGSVIVTEDSTVSISTLGIVACGPIADVTCDDTGAQAARYRVTGSNRQQVNIVADGSNLTRVGGGSIAFTPILDSTTVTLPNSGSTGTTFNVGGEIALLASNPSGIYTGDIEVTVEY